MLKDLEAGVIDTIVFWKLDRLTRQGLTGLHPLLALDAKLVSANEEIDTTSAMGKGVAGLLASMAEQESENTSLRVRRAHQAAAEKGTMHSGGPRGYGYTRGGLIVPEEAEVVREVARRALDGESFRSIAKDLNERGVTTTTGGPWHSSVLANLARSPRLAGLRTYNGDVYEGSWTAILSVSDHRKLVASKSEPRVLRRPYHLLAGIIYCGECGGKMKTMGFRMKNGQPFERYQCVPAPGQVNCGHVAVTKKSTELFVKDELFAALFAGELLPDEGTPPVQRSEEFLRHLLDDDRQALNDLAVTRFADRVITHAEYLAARAPLEERIVATERELADLQLEADQSDALDSLRPGKREDLEAWWERSDQHKRRDAIHAAVRRVEIRPAKRRGGNKFDHTRVTVLFNWPLLLKIAERA